MRVRRRRRRTGFGAARGRGSDSRLSPRPLAPLAHQHDRAVDTVRGRP